MMSSIRLAIAVAPIGQNNINRVVAVVAILSNRMVFLVVVVVMAKALFGQMCRRSCRRRHTRDRGCRRMVVVVAGG